MSQWHYHPSKFGLTRDDGTYIDQRELTLFLRDIDFVKRGSIESKKPEPPPTPEPTWYEKNKIKVKGVVGLVGTILVFMLRSIL